MVIEHDDRAWLMSAERLLARHGYAVSGCGGPSELPDGRCRLVETGRCELLDDADVVVNGLRIRTPANQDVLRALRSRYARTPVIVEVAEPDAAAVHEAAPGCRTIPFPVTPTQLLGAVDAAIPRPSPG